MGLGPLGLSRLPALPSLRSLRLLGTKLSDEDLACVRRLPNLRTLDLMETSVTDAGLAHLEVREARVALPRAMQSPPDEPPLRVTEAGLRDLRKAMPKLVIQH